MRIGAGWGWGCGISYYTQVKIITQLVIVEIPTRLYQSKKNSHLVHLTKIYSEENVDRNVIFSRLKYTEISSML